ncbi:NAD(P)/FAD-dependent oxidoreductase [Alloyangia pacifica]|uniref:Predicted NAD/FAD-binding protein n=1 Tax=Alloyangia pacifica TaxID=311180 RepID=A0A1I6S1N0_9RHOB|nr:FAD-dependent oxidoreductase [Alloyangia pacifica]SDG68808.1 Predicted NAD/FAD-binding protein [Alloyangia pacifica]SFS70780.1 Predicted NAD/FAD-binding protein [Alloyangia pacifica]
MALDLSFGVPQRVAVIGGGISGLATAWLLSQRCRVTLYEAAPRLGGHARTVVAGRYGDQPVDTGFIVFNYANYPHLTALFRDLDVPVQRSDMSFGVSLDGGRLEYALRSGNALFGQRSNLARPGFYTMIRDILRFNQQAEAVAEARPNASIGELVEVLGLGEAFRERYLYPICGAIWSTPSAQIGDFPAQALMRFLRNHALLSAGGQHQWWTVSGGSQSYVSRLATALEARQVSLRSGTPVRQVIRDDRHVQVMTEGEAPETYDQVVFACHADVALSLLAAPSAAERRALGSVKFQDNHAVLHRDARLMPNRRRCWSSWVFRTEPGAPADLPVGVTYWMNRLQGIPDSDPMFVTLNPQREIPDELIYDRNTFRHPVFDLGAIDAQGKIAKLQGQNRSWYTGAWLRNGFHEDGFASAVRVARQMLPVPVAA